jgi:hypothetical protein
MWPPPKLAGQWWPPPDICTESIHFSRNKDDGGGTRWIAVGTDALIGPKISARNKAAEGIGPYHWVERLQRVEVNALKFPPLATNVLGTIRSASNGDVPVQ